MPTTDEEALERQWPHWKAQHEAAARERGWARPTIDRFRAEVANGSLYVGSPETVATKLAATIQALGLGRFDLVSGVGTVPHEERMATIELYGREVIPRVRELLAAAPSFARTRRGPRSNRSGAPRGLSHRVRRWRWPPGC